MLTEGFSLNFSRQQRLLKGKKWFEKFVAIAGALVPAWQQRVRTTATRVLDQDRKAHQTGRNSSSSSAKPSFEPDQFPLRRTGSVIVRSV
jgi:hypothetical protein